jgi:hypothetical protein
MQQMEHEQHVVIGVDPHKLSATIEVVDQDERRLGAGRFPTDQAGYAAMRIYAKAWPERVWAVEGANGAGPPLAQRLLADGENVADVPAKLSARARLLDTGHNRKTDAHDAHAVAVLAVRTKTLRVLSYDAELEVLRMLVDARGVVAREGPGGQPVAPVDVRTGSPPARPAWKPCAASRGASPTRSIDNSEPTPARARQSVRTRVREGTAGRLMYPARPASTRTPTLRISHFPDPHQRRYPRPHRHGRPRSSDPSNPPLDNRGEPE